MDVTRELCGIPGKVHISRSLFYTIHVVKHITGGGKQLEAWAGVVYKLVNFHIDNFTIVDKVIDVLAPESDVGHTLHDELHGLRVDVYTFLSYGYVLHIREGIKASESTKDLCEDWGEGSEYEGSEYEVGVREVSMRWG